MKIYPLVFIISVLSAACTQQGNRQNEETSTQSTDTVQAKIQPVVVTEPVQYDTDDPAIWMNLEDPSESLIIGTDKEADGALYVFDLEGNTIEEKVVRNLQRPNNVDVAYGLILNGQPTDIAVTTERLQSRIRVFSVPDMQPIDGGGIPVFAGEGEKNPEFEAPMGLALYKNKETGKMYAIVSRKNGPTDGTYLWQYELEDNGKGEVQGTLVRKFGQYSGKKEIEAIAVDDELGYVYFSDENTGVRKYNADPEKGNEQLALFATEGFADDHEGISIYELDDSTGYILVSDQGANKFQVFSREGSGGNPHDHQLLKVLNVSTISSDGSEVTSLSLNEKFEGGLFVAMSEDKTFQFYRWKDLAGDELKVRKEKLKADMIK